MLTLIANTVSTLLDDAPLNLQIGLGIGVAVGLVLWLLGGKLARPGCALVGLVVGSGAAALLTINQLDPTYALLIIVGCGIAGCILAYLLFRVWMAISCSLIMGLAAVMICLSLNGGKPPTMTVHIQDEAKSTKPEVFKNVAKEGIPDDTLDIEEEKETQKPAPKEEASSEEDADDALGPDIVRDTAEDLLAGVREELGDEWSSYRKWWSDQSASAQRIMGAAAIIATIAGLLIGLIFPYFAASVQSALCGSALMTICGVYLIQWNTASPPIWLPHTPNHFALTISLITVLGLIVQWTLFRRKTDK